MQENLKLFLGVFRLHTFVYLIIFEAQINWLFKIIMNCVDVDICSECSAWITYYIFQIVHFTTTNIHKIPSEVGSQVGWINL